MSQDSCGDLTKHETDVLLGLYSGCECLWNTKNPDYKDKKIRVGAIRTIINGMRLETGKDFTTSQMQTALETISKKYWQELQQALEAENSSSSNGYKSQWRWFNFLDSFLRENMLHAQTLGLDVEEIEKPEVKAQKEDDGNDTDDYFCATVDSGDEDSSQPAVVSKRRGQMQVLPTQSRTPPSTTTTTTSSRPSRSRASSRRQEVNALINGSSYSAQSTTTDTHTSSSSRKRRREAAVSPATRSSLASAAGASGSSNVSHSRHGGGAGSSAPHTRSTKTAAAAGRLTSTEACQSDSLKISAQMADTLKAMQILLATSLTDQDQPAMVFARHIANELQQITDYAQRKQCMLDLQQVIMRYQTKQQQQSATAAQIKFEGRGERSDDEDIVGSGDRGTGSRASATTTQQQSSEEPLLLYFDTP